MASIGYATLQVIPSLRGMDAEVRRQLGGLDAAGRRAGQSSGQSFAGRFGDATRRVVSGVGRAMETGITTAALATGALAGDALVRGFSRLTTIQDSTAALTVSLGDAGKAADLLGDILDTVRGTPFNLDQFAAAGAQLVGMGVEAQKVPGYLTAIGEAAATRGARANEFAGRLTEAFGKMAAQGKVSLDLIWSLSDAGVNALAILANHFGVTTDEMRDMISRGAVPATEAMDALAEGIVHGSDGVAGATVALGGTMEALRETLTGARGGFGAALARLGATVIEPFVGLLTEGFNAGSDVLDQFGAKLSEFSARVAESPALQRFTDWLATLPEKAGPAIDRLSELAPALAPIAGALAGIASVNIAGALGPLGALIPAIGPIPGLLLGLVAVSPELRDALAEIGRQVAPLVGEIMQGLRPALEQLGPIVARLAEPLGGALLRAVEALAPLLPLIAELFVAIADAVAEVLPPLLDVGVTLLESLVPAVETLLPVITDLVPVFATFAETLASLIAETPPEVIQALVVAFLGFKGVQAAVRPVQGLKTAIDGVSQVASTMGVRRFKAFTEVLKSSGRESRLLGERLPKLRGALRNVGTRVGDAARGFGRLATEAGKAAGRVVAAGARMAASAARATAQVVAQIAVQIGRWIALGVQALIQAAKVALAWLISLGPIALVIAAVVGLVALIIANFDTIKEFIGKAWEWIKEKAAAAWDWITERIGQFVDFVASIPGRIAEFAGSLFDSVKEAATAVKDWIADRVSDVVDFFRRLPGRIAGVAGRAFDAVRNAMTKAKDWIRDRVSDVVNGFKKLGGRIRDALSNVKDIIAAPFKAAFNAIARFWNWTAGKLSFRAPSWVPGIGGKGFSMPKLPILHTGGIFRAQQGNEGLALLQDGEGVFTRDQMAALGAGLRSPSGGGVTVVIDGSGLDRRLLDWLRHSVRVEGRGDVQLALGTGR